MYDEKQILAQYAQWSKMKLADADLVSELAAIRSDREAINDRFYKDLEFGTGGLRGVIGAGTNRMNIYTVARVTQGYAAQINRTFEHPSVAVSYDSRAKSALFAQTAAGVFAANGITVHIFNDIMPTPVLSFAVRHLKCAGGIMITASHNPAQYNGYKVYGSDGGQMTLETSAAVLAEIERTDIFGGVKTAPFEEGLAQGRIRYIKKEVLDAYIASVSALSLHTDIGKDMPIVYTPLNGTGLKRCCGRFPRTAFRISSSCRNKGTRTATSRHARIRTLKRRRRCQRGWNARKRTAARFSLQRIRTATG
jgi:phosphoglucomutase